MTLIDSLPLELLEEILVTAIALHPVPANVISVNKAFHDVGTRMLYSQLHFNTSRQLASFSTLESHIPCPPREVSVTLAGGAANFDVFEHLCSALRRCLNSVASESTQADTVKFGDGATLPLDRLYLRLNSHISNPNLHQIYDALTLANPKTFIWLGPDPGHHFSTAIVPSATLHLFKAIVTWSAIEHIKLTNLSFPSDSIGLHGPPSHNAPLLPALPRLRTLYLGQATMLSPSAVAAMACLPGQTSLEQIRLVDTYQESIWGRRLRRADIEQAALSLQLNMDEVWILERIRTTIRCEAQNERIMGGDRSEGLTILE